MSVFLTEALLEESPLIGKAELTNEVIFSLDLGDIDPVSDELGADA